MSDSPYADLDRPPLHERALYRALVKPGALWRDVRVVQETGSTNADLAELAGKGEPEGVVLVTELQTAGRGRLGRSWTAPPRSGLMFSLLLRPAVPVARAGWTPLLAGVAVATAIRRMTEWSQAGSRFFDDARGRADVAVDARLKWPNDVLAGAGGRKLAGILVEKTGDTLIVGIGLNVSLRPAELPVPTATSLAIEGAPLSDRAPLLRAILRELETWYREWTHFGGDPETSGLRTAYKELCTTLGRQVRVELPGGETLDGTATDIDADGRLVVAGRAVAAGDVVHVR